MELDLDYSFCVVEFLDKPYDNIDEYICVPYSWIKIRRKTDRRISVAYPSEYLLSTREKVRKNQIFEKEWNYYYAIVKYATDSFIDAETYIRKKNNNLTMEKGCPNIETSDDKQESKRQTRSSNRFPSDPYVIQPQIRENPLRVNQFSQCQTECFLPYTMYLPDGMQEILPHKSTEGNDIDLSYWPARNDMNSYAVWDSQNLPCCSSKYSHDYQTSAKYEGFLKPGFGREMYNKCSDRTHPNGWQSARRCVASPSNSILRSLRFCRMSHDTSLVLHPDIRVQNILAQNTIIANGINERERLESNMVPFIQNPNVSFDGSQEKPFVTVNGPYLWRDPNEIEIFYERAMSTNNDQRILSENSTKSTPSAHIISHYSLLPYHEDGYQSSAINGNYTRQKQRFDQTLWGIPKNTAIHRTHNIHQTIADGYNYSYSADQRARSQSTFNNVPDVLDGWVLHNPQKRIIKRVPKDSRACFQSTTNNIPSVSNLCCCSCNYSYRNLVSPNVQDRTDPRIQERLVDGSIEERYTKESGCARNELSAEEIPVEEIKEAINRHKVENTRTKSHKENKSMVNQNLAISGNEPVMKRSFILPPEYKPHDTKWTLKHREAAPGLVELITYSRVFINNIKFEKCKRVARDYKTLARMLLTEIFSQNALSVCSLTGARANAFDINGTQVRPGLDEHARIVLLTFIEEHGRSRSWGRFSSHCVLNSIRSKIQEMRSKYG